MSTRDASKTETQTQTNGSVDDRLEHIEAEIAELRDYVETVDENAVNESTLNLLIDTLAASAGDVNFEVDPGQNRDALATVDERLADLETAVELLQHDAAEVQE